MSERTDISGNYGSTNTLNNLDYFNLVSSTCKQIYDILAAHCGPYATDALIITENNHNLKDRHYAIFTKDGINIVRAIEFQSPIQKHIQSLIAYIGERVDSLSHDGTTTSMMMFTKTVELFFNDLHNCEEQSLRDPEFKLNRREIKKNLLNQLQDIFNNLELGFITLKKLEKDFNLTRTQAIQFVSYHQAMLSSKGDVELSKAITEVVETLPTELYGLFSVTQSGIESDKRFTVLKDDYNFVLPVQWNLDDMNYNMGTEYLSECCDIIVSEDGLSPGNIALEIIIKHIGKIRDEAFITQFECEDIDLETGAFVIKDAKNELAAIAPGTPIQLAVHGNPLKNGLWIYNGPGSPVTHAPAKKDLVIIAKSIDSSLLQQIQSINKKSPNKIVVYTMSITNPYSSKVTILSALLNTAGVYHLSEHIFDESRPYLIQDAKVHFKHRRLYVSNLYKKDGTQYHPFFNNPGLFEPYTKMVKEIKAQLDEYTSGRLRFESAQDQARYQDYIEIYRRMICSEVRQLQISGLTHDVLADKDILQDSFGAVLSSLENGFILDGYLRMNMFFQDKEYPDNNPLNEAVVEILAATHKKTPDQIRYFILENGNTFNKNKDNSYFYYPAESDNIVQLSIEQLNSENSDQVLVMQPADTYRELFKRLTDLLPKLINTNRVIIPGTSNKGIDK